MIRFYHHPIVLNHIKIIFSCSCGLLLGSPDFLQRTGTKFHFTIAFSIEWSLNFACFCAFGQLVFENHSIFGHGINRFSYSCGLLIAFFKFFEQSWGEKLFRCHFSGHWNFTDRLTCDVIMANIMGSALAWLRNQSWPLPLETMKSKKLTSRLPGAVSVILTLVSIRNHSYRNYKICYKSQNVTTKQKSSRK